YDGLPPGRLVLTTSARVFTRVVSIAVEHPADERHRETRIEQVSSTAWTHADQERDASPLGMPVAGIDRPEIYVVVDEGDNTPLPIVSARLLLPAYRARLFREAGAGLRV